MPTSLRPFIDEARAIAFDASSEFGTLTYEQLNWKPAPERWSVAQCLDHLMVIDSGYFPLFDRIASGSYTPPLWRRLLFPKAFGSMILKAVEPQAPRAYKTSSAAAPARGDIGADVVERFEAHERTVAEHLEKLDARQASDLIIGSPVLPLASYSVLDAARILVAHARRHLLQARRVTEEAGFPRALVP